MSDKNNGSIYSEDGTPTPVRTLLSNIARRLIDKTFFKPNLVVGETRIPIRPLYREYNKKVKQFRKGLKYSNEDDY